MLQLIGGLGALGGSIALLRWLWPRNGASHPIVLMPVLDTCFPLTITVGLVMGIALVISGFSSLG